MAKILVRTDSSNSVFYLKAMSFGSPYTHKVIQSRERFKPCRSTASEFDITEF